VGVRDAMAWNPNGHLADDGLHLRVSGLQVQ
jgi:hypothetical protein